MHYSLIYKKEKNTLGRIVKSSDILHAKDYRQEKEKGLEWKLLLS